MFAKQFVLVEHPLLAVDLFVGVGEPVVPDERHPLDEPLVGSDHPIKPPAVVLAPGVGRVERLAFVVGRRGAVQRGRAAQPRHRMDNLFKRLAGEGFGLPGRRPEAGAPQQPLRLGQRDRAAHRGRWRAGRRWWAGRNRRRRRSTRQAGGERVVGAVLRVALAVLAALVKGALVTLVRLAVSVPALLRQLPVAALLARTRV